MKLNAQMLIEEKIILDPENLGKCAQVGYDLTIKNITRIKGGFVPKEGKATIAKYSQMPLVNRKLGEEKILCWELGKGIYSLTFDQGIRLDEKHSGEVKHRSSVLRCSGQITSGEFDPGFECENIGATLIVHEFLQVELGSRLAQVIVQSCWPTEKYEGSYQGDKDLK